ncbi:MAG: DedA family protein [Thermoanaerobaculales bacterium]
MLHHLADLVARIEPHAVLLALALPPVIRLVGHWLPEELFMIAMGVLAARSDSPQTATMILGAVVLSHFVTDQGVYLGGRWLRPRLGRFPRIERRLQAVTGRLAESRGALLSFIPARVLPLGRGAWLAACGVVRVPWPRFVAVDLAALVLHLAVWSGLGWWLAGDLQRLTFSADLAKLTAVWLAVALIAAITAVIFWRRRDLWQAGAERVMRRVDRTERQAGRRD